MFCVAYFSLFSSRATFYGPIILMSDASPKCFPCVATRWQVFTANIKTKHKEGKWVMAGVALLMDVV
jgi:hypothetical protein